MLVEREVDLADLEGMWAIVDVGDVVEVLVEVLVEDVLVDVDVELEVLVLLEVLLELDVDVDLRVPGVQCNLIFRQIKTLSTLLWMALLPFGASSEVLVFGVF